LSMHEDEGVVAKMLDAGAAAFLTKDGVAHGIVDTIRAVAAKGTIPSLSDPSR